MAIYHLYVKVIGRKAGSSAVASAAYRSGSRLCDERLDRTQDFSAKRGVVHSEVLLPENAPVQWSDRERLRNDVEAFEVRKDAQLAREVEFAIPREMTQAQGIELARDFVQSEFVDQGMIADLNVHWDIGEDGSPKPHAHVMLTMRSVDENGFGPKVRDWNRTEMVERWRERWADHVNERLAEDLRRQDAVVFVFPTWWFSLPPMLEGYIGRVWNHGIAYGQGRRLPFEVVRWIAVTGESEKTFTKRGLDKSMAHRLNVGIAAFCGASDSMVEFLYDTLGEEVDDLASHHEELIAQARKVIRDL